MNSLNDIGRRTLIVAGHVLLWVALGPIYALGALWYMYDEFDDMAAVVLFGVPVAVGLVAFWALFWRDVIGVFPQ